MVPWVSYRPGTWLIDDCFMSCLMLRVWTHLFCRYFQCHLSYHQQFVWYPGYHGYQFCGPLPRMATSQKEVYYRHKIWHLNLTKFTKGKPGNNFHGWSPTIPGMVTHQPKDGHPPEGSALQTYNLALK